MGASTSSHPPLLVPRRRPSGRGRGGDGGGSSSKSHIEEDSCDGGSGSGCEADDTSKSAASSQSNASCEDETPPAVGEGAGSAHVRSQDHGVHAVVEARREIGIGRCLGVFGASFASRCGRFGNEAMRGSCRAAWGILGSGEP
ncbi:hypothetical protein ZEAMMB73_Zm00001d036694 [Zea mays]|uniref:Uncharacterized protein n=1 Tax=Zea mays TaxID=4577 RepID=A0A1D6LQH5_MAIZE|nr:hypothetical protein ZEAMMB73_Zm00001d036694 [Zea mays]